MIYSNNKTPPCMTKSTIWNLPYCNNRFSKAYSQIYSYCNFIDDIFGTLKYKSTIKQRSKTKTIGNKLK